MRGNAPISWSDTDQITLLADVTFPKVKRKPLLGRVHCVVRRRRKTYRPHKVLNGIYGSKLEKLNTVALVKVDLGLWQVVESFGEELIPLP